MNHRAMWDTMERRRPDTVARAGRLPEGALRPRAGDQWSFRREAASSGRRRRRLGRPTILDEPVPHYRLGLLHPAYPPADATAVGIDVDACPSLAEVLEVRENRMALVRGIPAAQRRRT